MNEVDVAWAAGVLEGEGCFSIFKRKSSNYWCFAIHCEMSDEDVVRRLHSVFSLGNVNVRKNISGRRDTRKRKQTYLWSVQNKADICVVLEAIHPFMGQRRSEKISEMLKVIREIGIDNRQSRRSN